MENAIDLDLEGTGSRTNSTTSNWGLAANHSPRGQLSISELRHCP